MEIMSEQVNELFCALSLAQGEMRLVEKSANNPFFKSKYADLGAFIKESREVLAKHGLTVTQIITYENNSPMLITLLGHKSGQWLKGYMPILCTKNTPQEMGSAITYARRYAYAAITGMTGGDDDDDGQMAETGLRMQNESNDKKIHFAQAASKDERKVSVPQQNTIAKVFKEFPELEEKFIAHLSKGGKKITLEEIPEAYFDVIMNRADLLRKSSKQEEVAHG